MAELGTPSKPPRGNKTGKETGVLMSVIKSLSSSASTDHRDKEKSKLEKEFRRSDQKLDSLVSKHQESLNAVMMTFGHVCGEIEGAKSRLASVKGNLQKCKMLLHCRREELERLWLEGIEHKHALGILEQIERLRSNSDQFNKLLTKKQYLQAVEVLMSSINSWNENLDKIEGLREVRTELKMKKEVLTAAERLSRTPSQVVNKIYETLKEELYNEMYYKLNNPNSFEKRQGSGVYNPFQRSSSDRMSSGRNRGAHVKARKIFLDFGTTSGINGYSKPGDAHELDTFISMTVECMVLLKEVPRFSEDLKNQMEEKLLGVINSASQQVIEFGDTNGINVNDASLFSELLKLLFSQFRWIVKTHLEIISAMNKAIGHNHSSSKVKLFYDEDFVWSRIQSVLKSTLKIYFDLSDSKSDHSASISPSRDSTTNDINNYFLRKKPSRPKRTPLFKFEYSLHGLNINEYVSNQDTTDRSNIDRTRFLVCKPSPRNIVIVYSPVQEFVSEIEQATNGKKSDLRKFMMETINRVFVQQLYKEISDAVELARKNSDCWRDVISAEEIKSLKCTRPLLQSVVQIGRSVQEIIPLSKDLPSHSEQLLRILESLLISYKEACQNAYAGIVQPDTEDKGVISATWVKDEDIERLLKTLPNWLKLQKAKEKKLTDSMDESPEDVRTQNLRESDLLTGIFNGKTVMKHEILSDVKQLEQLAHLQESLEWFADVVKEVSNTFYLNPDTETEIKELSKKVLKLAVLFQELADICLLVLHLEIRVHCFFYLLPMAQKGEFSPNVDSQNPDSEVVQLNKDLSSIEYILSTSLQAVKTRYIFQGLGQLISTILIGGAEHIQRINDNGVKKMCRNIYAIQRTLCEITNQPEHAMDHARQYYELFTLTPEELVDAILEKGPQFKELEYMNALKLLFKSKPGYKSQSLDEHLNRLSNILGDVGVVV